MLELVWDYQYFGDERTVDAHIKKLRQKLKRSDHKLSKLFGESATNLMILVLPNALFVSATLSFCGMVALILLIVGVSFTQLTKQTIEENNYQQLFGYAESVEKTTQTYADTLPQFSQDQAFQNALLLTEQVLTEQNVNFIFIDKMNVSFIRPIQHC